jgi:predicted transposase/invertase (TIGR01784 family)
VPRVRNPCLSSAGQAGQARALFYWAKLYSSQIGRGEPHSDLKASVSVFILGFRDLPGPRFHSKSGVLELTDHEPFSDHLELHVVELPKLRELSGGLDEEADLVRWGRFLAAGTDQEREQLAMQDPTMSIRRRA